MPKVAPYIQPQWWSEQGAGSVRKLSELRSFLMYIRTTQARQPKLVMLESPLQMQWHSKQFVAVGHGQWAKQGQPTLGMLWMWWCSIIAKAPRRPAEVLHFLVMRGTYRSCLTSERAHTPSYTLTEDSDKNDLNKRLQILSGIYSCIY